MTMARRAFRKDHSIEWSKSAKEKPVSGAHDSSQASNDILEQVDASSEQLTNGDTPNTDTDENYCRSSKESDSDAKEEEEEDQNESNHLIEGSSSKDGNKNETSLINRLSSYLAPFNRFQSKSVPGTKRTDGSTASDFVYQAFNSGEDEHRSWRASQRGGQKRRLSDGSQRLPAFYYAGHSDRSLGRTILHRIKGSHNQNQNQKHRTLSPPNRIKTLLLSLALLILVMCACALITKLISLLQVEHEARMDNSAETAGDKNSAGGQLMELMLNLSSKLDATHRKQLEANALSKWLVATPKCHIPAIVAWDKSILGYVKKKPPMNCSALLLRQIEEKRDELQKAVVKEESSIVKSLSLSNKKIRDENIQKLSLDLQSLSTTLFKTISYVLENKLYFSQDALELGALLGGCCFRRVLRTLGSDDELEYANEGKCEQIFQQGIYVNSSMVEVHCAGWNYSNIHTFIVPREDEENILLDKVKERLTDNEDDRYNVLMVGVDTISRLNAYRQLDKTLKVLKDFYNTLEFVGYNKVGENTFPNLIPLLTGLKPEQLTEVRCWLPKNYTQENERGDDYLDSCKYLWNYFQQVGYVTYFSEDWPAASTFNYLKPGFKNEPTNYYGRPFTLARRQQIYPKFESVGCASCQLDRPIVSVDLDNLKLFVESRQKELPYFAFHWINCPQHDDLNGASQVDHILEKFFLDLHKRLENEKTFVMFFSDHGYRWGSFVSTRVGHYESSMPLLTIAPPKKFIERHPELYQRLKAHQNALLTPFDLFKTFISLRDLSAKRSFLNRQLGRKRRNFLPNAGLVTGKNVITLLESADQTHETDFETKTAVKSATSLANLATGTIAHDTTSTTTTTDYPTAATTISEIKVDDGTTFKQSFKTLSLFDDHNREELDRSCIDAGIPDNYCVCHQFKAVDSKRLDVLGAAYYLVYAHFKERLRDHLDICRQLDLENIHQAEVFDLKQRSASKSEEADSKTRRRRLTSDRTQTRSSKVVTNDFKSALKPLNDKLNSTSTAKPANLSHSPIAHKHNYLPNREFSIMLSTKPGGGLFQEVIRFYGKNTTKCVLEVAKTKKVIEDDWAKFEEKFKSVSTMNEVCEYSVHSDSLSRFNLYKDQSKCVTSNIELKKICYCNDLD